MTAISAPIPIGGWNARDALATMPPTDAIELVNLVPSGDALKVRPGYTAATGALGAAVQTLVTYHGGTETLRLRGRQDHQHHPHPRGLLPAPPPAGGAQPPPWRKFPLSDGSLSRTRG